MDWIALLQVAGPVLLGLAGIGGTAWGVRHQTASQAREAMRTEQRTTYVRMLEIAAEVEAFMPSSPLDAETMKRLYDPTTHATLSKLSTRARSVAQRCALVGDSGVRISAESLTYNIGHIAYIASRSPSRSVKWPEIEAAANALAESNEDFRAFARFDVGQVGASRLSRWRQRRRWDAGREKLPRLRIQPIYVDPDDGCPPAAALEHQLGDLPTPPRIN